MKKEVMIRIVTKDTRGNKKVIKILFVCQGGDQLHTKLPGTACIQLVSISIPRAVSSVTIFSSIF